MSTGRDSLGSVVWVAALGCLCIGCGVPPTPARGQPVPAEAPDTVPSTIFEDAMFIEGPHGDLVSTTILSVGFDAAASHAAKESAIHSVSGTVIGGAAGDVEGLYLVRVLGDGTLATIDSIAAELRSLPGVGSVAMLSLTPVG